MTHMSATTGKAISEIDHLEQSIRDILTTPVGSRVMRRDYGCRLFYLIGQPMSQLLVGQMQAAIADALRLYEPRVRFNRIVVQSVKQGRVVLTLEGYYIPENRTISFNNIII